MQDQTTPSAAFPDGIDHSATEYNGKEGTVTVIDDTGQFHGTWGGLAVIPGVDEFVIVLREPQAADPEVRVVVEDAERERNPVTGVWYDPITGEVRITF